MSLDVYLDLPEPLDVVWPKGSGIFIRENGETKEITRAEWDARYPGQEPVIVLREAVGNDTRVYRTNITHNLNRMAYIAGIYYALWRPDKIHIQKAQQLIEPLRAGLRELRSEPAIYEKYNPSNGWGSYEGLVHFVEKYLAACEQYPHAWVHVSR
jgi:hypothetical protein